MNKKNFWQKRRLNTTAVAAVVLLGLVTGCSAAGNSASTEAGNADCENVYTIGYSHPAGDVAAIKTLKGFVEERAAENGCVEILLDNTVQNNLETQRRAIESWVTQKIDAIVVWPVDNKAVDDLRVKAQAQGTKWLTYAAPIPEQDGGVGFDNDTAGKEMAAYLEEWVDEHYPDRNITAAVTTATALPALDGRTTHIVEALEKMGIEIVSKQDCIVPDCGMQIAEDALRQHSNLKIFVGLNDDASVGALRALQNAGTDMNSFFLAGYDGSEEAIVSLSENTGYTASAAIPLKDLGYSIIDNSVAAISGEGDADNLTPMIIVTPEKKDILADLLALF